MAYIPNFTILRTTLLQKIHTYFHSSKYIMNFHHTNSLKFHISLKGKTVQQTYTPLSQKNE